VPNVLEWNSHDFEIGGPAEYSAASEKFLFKPLLQIKGHNGWIQDRKTARFSIDGKPKADTLEKVVTFYLEQAPKAR
jgi:hypothetical protein